MSMYLSTRRTSARARRCDTCPGTIKSGSVYLRHTTPARLSETGTWQVHDECGQCATMFGRAGLLEIKESREKR